MAPLILRRPIWVLVTLITLSFFVRVFLALDYDFRFDPWSYRFFPSELLYFLSGSLAYRLSKDELSTGAKKIILTLCFILTLLAGYKAHFGLGSTELFLSHIALGLLFVFIPKIFEISKNISFDRYMGELSYPLYISHMLVIWVTALIFVQGSMQQRVAIFLGTVLLSVGIFVLVEKRVDRWRHRVFANKT
jgi:peptidoglycan/LPS O-acetylase OafA/YrhL